MPFFINKMVEIVLGSWGMNPYYFEGDAIGIIRVLTANQIVPCKPMKKRKGIGRL